MRTYMMIADHCFGSELKNFKARKNEHKMNKKKTKKKFREKLWNLHSFGYLNEYCEANNYTIQWYILRIIFTSTYSIHIYHM